MSLTFSSSQMSPEYEPILMRSNMQALKWEKETSFEPLDDTPMSCGDQGFEFDISEMVNPAVYTDLDSCLEFARAIKNDHRYCADPLTYPFHIYWNGPVGAELIMAVRSFFATQDLGQSMLWVWSDDPEPVGNPE